MPNKQMMLADPRIAKMFDLLSLTVASADGEPKAVVKRC